MTKKDYIAIASIIARITTNVAQGSIARSTAQYIAENLADVMQGDNPRFDRARFLAACGVQS